MFVLSTCGCMSLMYLHTTISFYRQTNWTMNGSVFLEEITSSVISMEDWIDPSLGDAGSKASVLALEDDSMLV